MTNTLQSFHHTLMNSTKTPIDLHDFDFAD